MSGAGVGAAGQQETVWQSAGEGQPALKEKLTLASCESIVGGGSEFAVPATRVSV